MQLNSRDLSDDALEAALEPSAIRVSIGRRTTRSSNILDSLITLDPVGGSNAGLAPATLGDTLAWPGHAAVEVHSVDTNSRVVLDAEIDVFADTETEVAGL
jgi:hypothetical protein